MFLVPTAIQYQREKFNDRINSFTIDNSALKERK